MSINSKQIVYQLLMSSDLFFSSIGQSISINLYFPLEFIFGSLLSLWSCKLFQTRNKLESFWLQKSDRLQKLFLAGDWSFFKWTFALHWYRNFLYSVTNSLGAGLSCMCFENAKIFLDATSQGCLMIAENWFKHLSCNHKFSGICG